MLPSQKPHPGVRLNTLARNNLAISVQRVSVSAGTSGVLQERWATELIGADEEVGGIQSALWAILCDWFLVFFGNHQLGFKGTWPAS